MSYTRLIVKDLSKIVGYDGLVLIVLADEHRQRQVVVPCDPLMGEQLKLRMCEQKHPICDKWLPEILVSMLAPKWENGRIIIKDFHDGRYLTYLYDAETSESKEIRCSDGVLLSLIADVPLYIDSELFRLQSVAYTDHTVQMPLPINVLNDKLLEESMQRAISAEDYEMASTIRDELKRRKHKNHNSDTLFQ